MGHPCFVQTMRRQMIPHGVRVGQVSPGPVISALLADWPEENLRLAKESGSLIEPSEVADAVEYMLTRNRNVTIRDMLVLHQFRSREPTTRQWPIPNQRGKMETYLIGIDVGTGSARAGVLIAAASCWQRQT
jgi:short-subunit dehydrogenase